MGLFRKASQCITLYGETQAVLDAVAQELRTRKIKDTKVSSVKHADEEWECRIDCKLAETVYYQEVLPLLYSSAETQSLKVMLELDHESEAARRCPKEILVSFDLKSRYAFGDKADDTFVRKLRKDIVEGLYGELATVCYYIVGGGCVTMSIPCLDLSKMEEGLHGVFKAHGIKRFLIKHVDRERG